MKYQFKQNLSSILIFLFDPDLAERKCEDVRFRHFRLSGRLRRKNYWCRLQTIHGGKCNEHSKVLAVFSFKVQMILYEPPRRLYIGSCF